MAVLKKPVKKSKVEEKVPMWHENDNVQFDDGDGNMLEGIITNVDNDGEVATVEVGDDSYEVEFSELQPVEKKAKSTKKVAKPSEEEEEEKPTKKGKSKKSGDPFAEALRNTKAASKGSFLAAGDYEGLVTEITISENDKGKSLAIKYTVVNNDDDELNGKSAVSFYNIVDENGDALQGMEYMKRDLDSLGFSIDDQESVEDEAEFITKCEELAEANVYVSFRIREKNGYTNVFLQDVLDQDDKPELS